MLREEREEKVAELVRSGLLRSERLRRAMLRVAREDFLPSAYRDHAYEEVPLPLPGRAATVSCPHSYPLFYEALELKEGQRFLEVGLGSGYGAALAREVVGPAGMVVSVEIDPDTLAFARANLDRNEFSDVVCVLGDGGLGWPTDAPYDRICVTAACPEVPGPLVEQLREGGRLIAPVRQDSSQKLTLLEKTAGGVRTSTLCDVLYVDLQGLYGVKAGFGPTGRRPALVVTCPSLAGGRSSRRALRLALPEARACGTGFRGVLRVDAEGDPLTLAEQVVTSCRSSVARVTAVIAEVPSHRDALRLAAVRVAHDHVGMGDTFAFRIHKRGAHGYLEPTPTLQADIGGAIWESLAERDRQPPRVDLRNPDVLINAEVFGPTTLIGLVMCRWSKPLSDRGPEAQPAEGSQAEKGSP